MAVPINKPFTFQVDPQTPSVLIAAGAAMALIKRASGPKDGAAIVSWEDYLTGQSVAGSKAQLTAKNFRPDERTRLALEQNPSVVKMIRRPITKGPGAVSIAWCPNCHGWIALTGSSTPKCPLAPGCETVMVKAPNLTAHSTL